MKSFEMISLEQAKCISLNRLVTDYNSAIETIWDLQRRLQEQIQENEQLWKAYEDISDELYG